MEHTLTIFTPTYNRADRLASLYQSLAAQTSKDFIWLVVDDGSTDNTKETVQKLQAEKLIDICYLHCENQGKPSATNLAAEACTTELFMTVDDDDRLVPDAVETTIRLWQEISAQTDSSEANDRSVAGIIALDGSDAHTPLRNREFPEGVERTTLWELINTYHHTADTSIVLRASLCKQFSFELAPGEKFMGEGYVYHAIGEKHDFILLNRVIKIVEYLPGGLSDRSRQITRENPNNYMKLKRRYIGYSPTFKLKFKNTALYLVGGILAGKFPEAFRNAPYKGIAVLATPLAFALCHTVFRERI